ncbi:conserved hypothetical protein [Myxococcus xanthus DK 1622]|uniref:ABC-three component systems C-terminal domain-containing protein n=1 Tax=Myxococcus xanthus (strain DK1622) TaxID=246197 RepID=Q1DB24_MYXXD|nr:MULTISPECIES: ABC-three component system protein [Myxococcus]ABF88916.1 conserved hypothetical protein [Myxococcus xanthus DK 1622]NOJ54838.1 hypothetical protein [Myxococcus xanthus]QPM81492.1 hypothetical protein I5Q59_09475 [Myxococcus xanthus]QVW70742.1 hypothetical protein JTM82_14835 [Myxococcus xanthus DZ2]QZZ49652.1 hypothetical protein MyxoNM_10585 [Myxococcus xanthus]
MKYSYADLSPEQFESLVVFLCQQLLGISVQGFSKGPDGGRDAKFIGTAELLPSRSAPWRGTVIVQAKHTNGVNKTFSDADFFGEATTETVLGKEIPRIKSLRAANALDHYMLFSNRRLAGNADEAIRGLLSRECGLPHGSLYLCGVEQLEMWLKTFPQVATLANIDPVDSPLIVSPDELAELVEAFARNQQVIQAAVDSPPTPRVSYADKNSLNNMSEDYARQQRRNYLKDTTQIQAFLAAPENLQLRRLYETVVMEFQLKITAKRKSHQSFDDVLEYLTDLLFGRDPVLRSNKRLTRAMLFYMYWHCDIGTTGGDDSTD